MPIEPDSVYTLDYIRSDVAEVSGSKLAYMGGEEWDLQSPKNGQSAFSFLPIHLLDQLCSIWGITSDGTDSNTP